MATQTETEQIRRRLHEERESLSAQIEALRIDTLDQADDYGSGHHYGDDATDLFLRERNIPLRSNAEDLIAEIDTALARLDAGTYGACARCGQPIGAERLAALPYATLCLRCKQESEADATTR